MKQFITAFLLFFFTFPGSGYQNISGFSDISAGQFSLKRSFCGFKLNGDDLENGSLMIRGKISPQLGIEKVEISIDNGNSWRICCFSGNEFFFGFVPAEMAWVYQIRLSYEVKDGNRYVYPGVIAVNWDPRTGILIASEQAQEFFRSLERGHREEVMNRISPGFPFRYRFEDRLIQNCTMNRVFSYHLRDGRQFRTGNVYQVEQGWNRVENGVSTEGFNQLMFRRENDGEFKICRIKGSTMY